MHKADRLVDKLYVLRNGALWDKIYKNSFLQKYKLQMTEGLYTADNIFVLKAFYYAQKITLIDEPRYLYTVQSDSIGIDINKQEKRKNDVLEVCGKILDFVRYKHLKIIEKLALYDFLYRSLFSYPDDKKFIVDFDKKIRSILCFYNKINLFYARILNCLCKKFVRIIKSSVKM